jgi:hypothetical protein
VLAWLSQNTTRMTVADPQQEATTWVTHTSPAQTVRKPLRR